MNKRVTAVLVCTFLGLLAATVWVPVRWEVELRQHDRAPIRPPRLEVSEWRSYGGMPATHSSIIVDRWDWAWAVQPDLDRTWHGSLTEPALRRIRAVGYEAGFDVWTADEDAVPMAVGTLPLYWVESVSWLLVVATQGFILLLGGGLLTWVVRRERRRKAAAT